MKIGDNVKFIKLLSEDHEEWKMNLMQFNYVRMLIGQTGKIKHVQLHYENNGAKSTYLDVEFSCGFILKAANSVAFALTVEN